MLDLLIISDDFTGALDTGVKFSSQNIKTIVTTDIDIDIGKLDESVKVLVINNDTRHLSGIDAYKKTKLLLDKIDPKSYRFLYKKIDSAFRGNIGQEIKATFEFFPGESIALVGAYPEMNRIIDNGILYIDGIKVEESIFSKDPFEPVKESSIKKILKKDLKQEIVVVNELKDDKLKQEKEILYSFDGKTYEDLEIINDILENNNLKKIMVGCAGFAEILSKNLSIEKHTVEEKLNYPIAIISGSLNQISIDQIEHFKSLEGKIFSINDRQVEDDSYWESNIDLELKKYIAQLFEKEEKVVYESYTLKNASDSKLNNENRFKIANAMARLTKYLIEDIGYRDFFVVGGDTLQAIMKNLGITEIQPVKEIFPGAVLTIISYKNITLRLASKSGGFGNKELLEKL